MTLPIGPSLYGLPPPEIEPRLPPMPMMGVPPPEFMPERAQYLPPEQPGGLDRFLAPFAGGVPLRPGAPPLALLLAGILQGMGQQRLEKQRRGEETRLELNKRFTSDAALRNRENLLASRSAEEKRIDRLQKESATEREAARKIKEKEDEEANRRLTPAEARAYELPLSATLVPIAKLPPAMRDRIGAPMRAEKSPPNVTAGAEIPSIAAVEQNLTGEAQRLRTSANSIGLPPPAAADSLTGLARGIMITHARLREAQSTAEVDSIVSAIDGATDVPESIRQTLKQGAAFRRRQLANPR